MNRYANGKIYMIESLSVGLVYYGSSCSPLSKRLSMHKSHYKEFKNGTHGPMTSFDIIAQPDHKIILVESYPCNTREELHAREAHYIRNNECVNKQVAGRTTSEWGQDNKDKIRVSRNKQRKNTNM